MTHSKITPPVNIIESWRSAVEDAEELRDASPREHFEAFAETCRLVTAILARSPDEAARYDAQVRAPAASQKLLERLRSGA